MNKVADLEALVAVVESNRFSIASERLNIAKSVVSRRISQLEQRLGGRLLHRTTRRISLTDEGKQFYQRAVQILSDLNDAEQSICQDNAALRGAIKLATPLSFGLKHVTQAIAEFLQSYPDITLNLDLNDRNINLVEEGFDMTIRVGNLQDSTLIAKQLSISRTVTCASQSYLDKYGEPTHPDQLSQHFGLQYSNVSYKEQWCYEKDNSLFYAQPQIRLRANNGEALATAAMSGVGIVSGPTFLLNTAIQSKQLKLILKQFKGSSAGIYAVYPPGRLTSNRVKVFTDFLVKRFGDHPYWDDCLCSIRSL
jgi:DNA-binding transcriptional LysR family regulator